MSTSGGTGVARAGNPFTTLAVVDGGMYSVSGALRRWRTKARPATTTAAVAILAGDTTWTVSGFAGFPLSGTAKVFVGTEEVLVTAGLGTTTWTVVRAINGTTAAGYGIGQRITSDPMVRIAVVGDSTVQGDANGVVGDGYAMKLARTIALELGLPLLSPQMGNGGFYPIYCNNDANIGGGANNFDPVWSATGGAWTLIATGVNGDRGPFGWSVQATGAANILQLLVPAYLGSIRAVDVYCVNTVNNQFSCDINLAGAWANAPGAGVAPAGNKIIRCRFTSASDITNFRIRAADAAATNKTPNIIGVDLWPTAPTFGTTPGVKLFNIGKDGDTLAQFNHTNASGDDFALLDSSNSDYGALDPDIVVIGPFTNDVTFWTNGVAYTNALQTLATRLFPRADLVFAAAWEQNTRSVPNQAALRQAVKNVAKSNGCAGIDMYDDFAAQGLVGWAAVNGAGYMGGDNLHLNALGVTEQGSATSRLLRIV